MHKVPRHPHGPINVPLHPDLTPAVSDLVFNLIAGLHGVAGRGHLWLLALLGEQEDGAGVCAGRVAADPGMVVQPLSSADQQHLGV